MTRDDEVITLTVTAKELRTMGEDAWSDSATSTGFRLLALAAARAAGAEKPVIDPVWMSGEWSHLFVEDGRQVERQCDLVFDLKAMQVVEMNVQRDHRWEASTQIERDDVTDSLVNANPEAIADPEENGFDTAFERPTLMAVGWPEGSGRTA
jgi:hypothetical protein